MAFTEDDDGTAALFGALKGFGNSKAKVVGAISAKKNASPALRGKHGINKLFIVVFVVYSKKC
jgi:hypothetical protein